MEHLIHVPGAVSPEQLSEALDGRDDLVRQICALYLHDYVCLGYALPPECAEAAPVDWPGPAMKQLMNG